MKIKRLSQLQQERQRLAIQRVQLEKDIQSDWRQIKRSASPSTLARHVLASCTDWMAEKWRNKRK